MSSQRQLVDEPDLVRVHEARVAHHVAAVGQVDGQHRAAAVQHRRAAVVVQLLVVVRADVAAGEHLFEVLEERRCRSPSRPRSGRGWGSPSPSGSCRRVSRIVALISPTFSLRRTLTSFLPSRISCRASRVQVGAERVGLARPAERRLGLLIRLEQGLVRPARRERRVLLDFVGGREHLPDAIGGDRQPLLHVLHRRMHCSRSPLQDLCCGLRTRLWVGTGPDCLARLSGHHSGKVEGIRPLFSGLANTSAVGGPESGVELAYPDAQMIVLSCRYEIESLRSLYFPYAEIAPQNVPTMSNSGLSLSTSRSGSVRPARRARCVRRRLRRAHQGTALARHRREGAAGPDQPGAPRRVRLRGEHRRRRRHPHPDARRVPAHSACRSRCPRPASYGAGLVFLPHDESRPRRIKDLIARIVEEEGQRLLGWRDVPTDNAWSATAPARRSRSSSRCSSARQ